MLESPSDVNRDAKQIESRVQPARTIDLLDPSLVSGKFATTWPKSPALRGESASRWMCWMSWFNGDSSCVARFVSVIAHKVKGLFRCVTRLLDDGLNRDLTDRNLSAHADVDVVFLQPWAIVKIADPMESAVALFVFESMGARIDGTEDELVVG